jgi:hypothetical protein
MIEKKRNEEEIEKKILNRVNLLKTNEEKFNYILKNLNNKKNGHIFEKIKNNIYEGLPKNKKEIIKISSENVTIDCEFYHVLKNTTNEVVYCIILNFLYDKIISELFLFDVESPLYKKIISEHKNIETFIYNLMPDVSKKVLKKASLECKTYIPEVEEKTEEDISFSPNDENDAINLLLDMFVFSVSDKFDTNPFVELDIDVLTALFYYDVYKNIYFGWYIDLEESNLRKYYKEKYSINDPYEIIRDLIKKTITVLKLKEEYGIKI